MKTIKTALQLSFFICAIFWSQSAVCQMQNSQATTPEAMANQQTKYEAAELKLDAMQAIDLGQINLIYAQELMELRKKANSENSKSDIEALKRSHANKIRSLLSSEKYRQYLELQNKKREEEKQNENG